MTRRDPVFIAWAVGLALAVLVFLVGPDHFMFRLLDTVHVLMWQVAEVLAQLSATALDVVRALSIGLFVTFLGLAFAVNRRGGRARAAIIVVTVVYLLLVGDAGHRRRRYDRPVAAVWGARPILIGRARFGSRVVAASVVRGRRRI